LKNLEKKPEIAVISGSGLESLVKGVEQIRIGTPFGLPSPIFLGAIGGKSVALLPRHGLGHSLLPHKVNYRANIYALRQLGAKRIIATNAVGTINKNFRLRDLVIPHDFIDFTKLRQTTFYEDTTPVIHIDMSQPYCPEIRNTIIRAAKQCNIRVWDKAVLVCTEGPRLETPAEIEMFHRLGGDLVGMTGVPEAVLSRELEMCYAAVCFVTNMAAGMQFRLRTSGVRKIATKIRPLIEKLLSETIKNLPRNHKCPCVDALENARF